MGFSDKPIVDRNSERSEDSVIITQSFFSKRNGFNSHIVDGSKDYGVDIHCELINKNGATGNIFPIQIKSTGKAPYVIKNSVKYFTLSFLTSRLGYLCRHIPCFGIVVFYNEFDDTLYYDYVWQIYNRIRLEKKDESWKEKNSVNIHIPEQNKVKVDFKRIHETFTNSFINTNILIEEHGNDFNIPSISLKKPRKSEKNENQQKFKAIDFLETIGPYLFNQREYSKIVGLIEILTKSDFHRPKISYIAAITYAELGELLDADYFLKLSYSKKTEYSEEEFLVLEMQRFKVDFTYGFHNKTELIVKLKQLKERSSNSDNLLNIDININMIEINQKIGELTFDKNILIETEKIYENIEKITQNEEQKNFQRIFQSENLFGVLSRIYSDFLNDNRLLVTENRIELLRNKNGELKEIMRSFEKAINIINDSLEYAIITDNKLMKAHALHKLAFAFFSMNLPFFINAKSAENKSDALIILKSSISNTISAYNLFLEIKVYHHAFHAITLAYEIYRLSEEWLGNSLNEICLIKDIKMQIEKFHNYEFYNLFSSSIDKILNDSFKKDNLQDLSDEKLGILADRILRIKNIPNERKENLLNELRSYQFFESNCKNKDLVLLSNQVYNEDLSYKQPTKYAIASKNTGVIYDKGFDIKNMMTKLGLDGRIKM